MEIKAIDISSYQNVTDFSKVKGSGVQYAIIRSTTKSLNLDEKFESHYAGCKKAGIKVGVYKFSYALTVADAIKEADSVLDALKGKTIELPVFLDLEWSEQKKLGVKSVVAIANAFIDRITSAGLRCYIYCNTDWYQFLSGQPLHTDKFWIARYPSEDNGTIVERLRPGYGIGWQYSSKGKIPGISGNCDLSVFYVNLNEKEENTMAKDLVTKALSYKGQAEPTGDDKFIRYYNNITGANFPMNVAWCAIFVTVIARMCAILTSVIPNFADCDAGMNWFKRNGRFKNGKAYGGNYTPKRNDIIFYGKPGDSTHVGYVISATKDTIRAIEGNKSDAVGERVISANSSYILGFGLVADYIGDVEPSLPEATTPDRDWLQEGDCGQEVITLQKVLNKQGFTDENGDKLVVDGSFGPHTTAAVTKAQAFYGITADGLFGSESKAVIYAGWVYRLQVVIGAGRDNVAGPETLKKTPTISAKKNMKHKAVRLVQEKYAQYGYPVGEIDGIAGSKFTVCTNKLQKDKLKYSNTDGELTSGSGCWKYLLGLN